MTKKLKTGLIGAGAFGANHARQLSQAPASDFQGVYDSDADRADDMAGRYGVCAFASLDDLFAATEALIIATPARTHAALASASVAARRHVLVEKPLAASLDDARALVAAAARAGVTLQAGHQERFVLKALGLFDVPEKPLSVESVREGPFTGRGMDVSVTFDLMIHDLDLVAVLFGDAPSEILATGRAERGTEYDAVEAHLHFTAGRARLTASRVAEKRMRAMRVTYPSGEVSVDFLSRTMRNTTPFALDPDFAEKAPDPLGQNVRAFLATILNGGASEISGESGAAAVALAAAIDTACAVRANR
ncbi:MAG: Gfo/Idh/MocA family oxidoreductase [Pseudomonadota bacterium]